MARTTQRHDLTIAQVTPYPPTRNGIGDYTADLCRGFAACGEDVSTVILADRAGAAPSFDGDVRRCWRPGPGWHRDVLAAATALAPDVVHIQHGFHFGFGAAMVELLRGLRERRIATVVTLHGVWPGSFLGSRRGFHRALAELADGVIVHQRHGAVDVLARDGVPAERVVVIPHGTATDAATDRGEARRQLGLSADRRIALFMGLVYRKKGLHTLVDGFGAVPHDVPAAQLLVAGRLRTDYVTDHPYLFLLGRRMKRGVAAGWLDLRAGHIPDEALSVYIAAADLVVFPYNRPQGSSSGVFHRAIAAGRPVLCSRCPTFGEALDAWGDDLPETFAEPDDPASWTRSLVKLLGDDVLRARAQAAAVHLARSTTWPIVAAQHVELYRRAVARPAYGITALGS